MPTRIGTSLETAVRCLESGRLVAIPTETVYGLAGNALDPRVVARIFSVKGRPSFDPLIVHLSAAEEVFRYASAVPDAAQRLMEAFWPGPLTMVLPRRAVIPDIVTAGLPTAAFRVPRHPVAQALLKRLPFPLAAPSANRFARLSPTRPEHVMEQLAGKISYILDGGPTEVGVESTIVRVADDGKAAWLLRPGGIPAEAVEKVLGMPLLSPEHSHIQAPGQMKRHYSPAVPLMLVDDLAAWIGRHGIPDATAFLAFHTLPAGVVQGAVLSPSGNLEEAAARLFAALHRFEKDDRVRRIVAEKVPETGLGRAINDRLRRAAAEPPT